MTLAAIQSLGRRGSRRERAREREKERKFARNVSEDGGVEVFDPQFA